MILLLVIGEKSAYKKESREREREREREAHRKATVALFSSSFEKNFTSFPCKNFVCCLERQNTNKSKSLPISTAHQSSIHRPLWARYVVKNRSNPPVFDRLECVCLVRSEKDRKETSDRARVEEEYKRWSSEIARKAEIFEGERRATKEQKRKRRTKNLKGKQREKNREKQRKV